MNPAQKLFLDFLLASRERKLGPDEISRGLASLPLAERAQIFVDAAFFADVAAHLQEEHWLLTQKKAEHQCVFAEFMSLSLTRELRMLAYLTPVLSNPSRAELQKFSDLAGELIMQSAREIRKRSPTDAGEFAATAMRRMREFVAFDTQWEEPRARAENVWQSRLRARPQAQWPETRKLLHETFLPRCLDRAFDAMDEILGIDYDHDWKMDIDVETSERIFEGSGAGVQSSYATVLVALEIIKSPPGAHWIDLGSGYGRVGLTVGLARPDLKFTGYEYVAHRVENSKAGAAWAGLQNVNFYTQDLSDENFCIPEADVYYLYDPFSVETYAHVLNQLIEIGRQKRITVATAADASVHFLKAISKENWSEPERYDAGLLTLCHSPKF